jgi:hypothetical protein
MDDDTTPPLTADQRLQQAMAAVAAKFGPAAAEMLRRHVEADWANDAKATRRESQAPEPRPRHGD